jgi:hypothetical protein
VGSHVNIRRFATPLQCNYIELTVSVEFFRRALSLWQKHDLLLFCRTHKRRTDRRRGLVHGKVLLLSQRRISDLVAFCLAYEFEDTFQAVTGAERIDATDLPTIEFSRRAYKLARAATGSSRAALRLAPPPRSKVALERDYELFFPVFSNAFELYSLATIPNWRQRCHKAACFITEVWTDQLPEYLLELLSEFDHIFLGLRHCVDDVARITGRPCSYLPLAIDVLRFAPATLDQPRPIEVCNIGRRSEVTHRALLADAERRQASITTTRWPRAAPT